MSDKKLGSLKKLGKAQSFEVSRKTEKKGLELFFKTLYNKRVMSEKLKAL